MHENVNAWQTRTAELQSRHVCTNSNQNIVSFRLEVNGSSCISFKRVYHVTYKQMTQLRNIDLRANTVARLSYNKEEIHKDEYVSN